MHPRHAIVRGSIPSVYVQPFTGVPSTLFQSNGTYKGILEETSVFKIRNMTLAVTVTASNDTVQIAPIQYWFAEIRMRAAGGSRLIHTMYDDTNFAALALVS